MIVRAVRPADRDAWLSMRLALWPDSEVREVDDFFAGRAREPLAVLVAEEPGALVGFAELSIRNVAEGCTTGNVGYLEGWWVDPLLRRRGIGRALVLAAEKWARSQGCTEFASDTQIANTASAAAHAALGFTEVEQIRCFRKPL